MLPSLDMIGPQVIEEKPDAVEFSVQRMSRVQDCRHEHRNESSIFWCTNTHSFVESLKPWAFLLTFFEVGGMIIGTRLTIFQRIMVTIEQVICQALLQRLALPGIGAST